MKEDIKRFSGYALNMWSAKPPKNDDEYFERLSHAIFQSGLNWSMVQKKWPGFGKPFRGFSIEKVAKLSDKDVRVLMKDANIIRNEKKIIATIINAQEFIKLRDEYGSFKNYMKTFKSNDKLMEDLENRFKHVGGSTSRTFLWMVGVKLKPTKEEKDWMAAHHHEMD